MDSPKKALELFGRYLDLSYTIDALTPETRDKMEAAIKAALPVAELEHQAVELIKREFKLRPFTFIKILGQDKAREMAKILEALKCTPQK